MINFLDKVNNILPVEAETIEVSKFTREVEVFFCLTEPENAAPAGIGNALPLVLRFNENLSVSPL
jgi:hypothetical protein